MSKWPAFLAFLRARLPELDASMRGVPPELIAELEQDLGVSFPRFYVDFLVSMGLDAGPYQPFGRNQSHDFAALVEALPRARYPLDRFFRVARQVDASVHDYDEPYLDLARVSDGDAALVTFSAFMRSTAEDAEELYATLYEWMADTAYTLLVRERCEQRQRLSVAIESLAQLEASVDAALTYLQLTDFEHRLPATRNLALLGRGDCWAKVDVLGPQPAVLSVELAGNDRREVQTTAAMLLDNLSGAKRMAAHEEFEVD